MTARVSSLHVAPVKGLALVDRKEVTLERIGVPDNRRFYLIDGGGRRYGLLRDARLALVVAEYDPDGERLSLHFPGGTEVAGTVEHDGVVETDFYGRPVEGRVVQGPWADALSEYVGRALRLVEPAPGAAVDRGDLGPVSILSDSSLDELARNAGVDAVDGRRFRMLVHVAGVPAHEEDTWLGKTVRVGEATVYLREQVARCAITTQNPDSGEVDLDTLREIKAYRGAREVKNIDFGVYGHVVEPGRVRVGDPVEPA